MPRVGSTGYVWMAAWYVQILWLHVGSVIASGALFCVRGGLLLAGFPVANHRVLRRLSSVIDTLLLVAAIALCVIIGQYPLVEAWLTVKVALLLVYIVLGAVAFRPHRRATRVACFAGAILVYLFIASVARTQSPWGAFRSLAAVL